MGKLDELFQLKRYIFSYLKEGKSEDELIKSLASKGWDKNTVKSMIADYKKKKEIYEYQSKASESDEKKKERIRKHREISLFISLGIIVIFAAILIANLDTVQKAPSIDRQIEEIKSINQEIVASQAELSEQMEFYGFVQETWPCANGICFSLSLDTRDTARIKVLNPALDGNTDIIQEGAFLFVECELKDEYCVVDEHSLIEPFLNEPLDNELEEEIYE
ncbi:MAG TPA: hypothetical protein ENN46_03440 [Candidatus Woesearchaeota archaeon]|nr:hypothetical protein [Candidatus Woesearchaeota archaeon]